MRFDIKMAIVATENMNHDKYTVTTNTGIAAAMVVPVPDILPEEGSGSGEKGTSDLLERSIEMMENDTRDLKWC